MGLPQHGGEGKENYKGNKSDSSLKQQGGEGGGSTGSVPGGGGGLGWTPSKSPNPNYTGPGRNLKSEKF